jgi:hypothetical protein
VTGDTLIVQLRTVVGKVLTGTRAGQTFKLEGGRCYGSHSADGRTLVSSVLTPGVETLTYSNGDVLLRICTASSVSITPLVHLFEQVSCQVCLSVAISNLSMANVSRHPAGFVPALSLTRPRLIVMLQTTLSPSRRECPPQAALRALTGVCYS